MAQEIVTEPSDGTHQHYPEDNISTSATHGNMSGDTDDGDEENSELEYPAFNMPPAPPPTRENSLANRGNGARGTAGLIHPCLLGLGTPEHNPDQLSTSTGTVPPSSGSNTSITADHEPSSGSQDQDEQQGEQQGEEQDLAQFNWGEAEADQEIEEMWDSIFPPGGRWNVDVCENVTFDSGLEAGMYLSVTVKLTENPPN